MNLPTGTLIDEKFEIIEPIGSGGFGTVYRANHIGLDRIVALKMVNTTLPDEEDTLPRFEREAKAISVLRHRNIVSIYGYGVWNGAPYMVLELLTGNSLETILADGRPLAANTTVRIMSQICAGLACAHQNGVVHRDLKTSNILLVNEGGEMVIKIIDFGLAKVMPGSGVEAQRLTEAGYALGSCAYMSPEQCTGSEVDHRADIYAAGCILYQCLTGNQPFQGDNPISLMYQHVNESPIPLTDVQPSFTGFPDLQSVVDRAMAKDHDERYQSIDLMAEELASAKVPTQQTQTSTDRLIGKKSHRPQKKKGKATWLVTSLCLIIASVVALIAFTKSQKQEPEDYRSASDMVRDAFLLKRNRASRLQAKALYQKALAKHQQDRTLNATQLHETYFELCDYALSLGKFEDTLDFGKKADKQFASARRLTMTSPGYGPAGLEASALMNLGRDNEATARLLAEIQTCKQLEEVYGIEQCHEYLAKAYFLTGNTEGLRKILKYELAHTNAFHRKRFQLLSLLGDVFLSRGLYDEAATAYTARVEPDEFTEIDDPNVSMTRLWMTRKNWTKANQAWKSVLAEDRQLTPNAYLVQSTLMAHNGDMKAARAAIITAENYSTITALPTHYLFLYDLNACAAALKSAGQAKLEQELQKRTAELQRLAKVRTDPNARIMRACAAKSGYIPNNESQCWNGR